MTRLHRRPNGTRGLVHDIHPENAGWGYAGFHCFRLRAGDRADWVLRGREAILVMVEGKATVSAAGEAFGELGDRLSVFDKTMPHCLYVPANAEWEAEATTDCTIAICTAPAQGGRSAQIIGPEGITAHPRGRDASARVMHAIAREERDVAESLILSEVFTPAGHWASYPPHRHDEDDFPRMTYLEKIAYHRIAPAQGFGIRRVFTDDGRTDHTFSVSDHDAVLIPRGHHPCAAAHGYQMYHLNVMAGPRRALRYEHHPDHAWIVETEE